MKRWSCLLAAFVLVTGVHAGESDIVSDDPSVPDSVVKLLQAEPHPSLIKHLLYWNQFDMVKHKEEFAQSLNGGIADVTRWASDKNINRYYFEGWKKGSKLEQMREDLHQQSDSKHIEALLLDGDRYKIRSNLRKLHSATENGPKKFKVTFQPAPETFKVRMTEAEEQAYLKSQREHRMAIADKALASPEITEWMTNVKGYMTAALQGLNRLQAEAQTEAKKLAGYLRDATFSNGKKLPPSGSLNDVFAAIKKKDKDIAVPYSYKDLDIEGSDVTPLEHAGIAGRWVFYTVVGRAAKMPERVDEAGSFVGDVGDPQFATTEGAHTGDHITGDQHVDTGLPCGGTLGTDTGDCDDSGVPGLDHTDPTGDQHADGSGTVIHTGPRDQDERDQDRDEETGYTPPWKPIDEDSLTPSEEARLRTLNQDLLSMYNAALNSKDEGYQKGLAARALVGTVATMSTISADQAARRRSTIDFLSSRDPTGDYKPGGTGDSTDPRSRAQAQTDFILVATAYRKHADGFGTILKDVFAPEAESDKLNAAQTFGASKQDWWRNREALKNGVAKEGERIANLEKAVPAHLQKEFQSEIDLVKGAQKVAWEAVKQLDALYAQATEAVRLAAKGQDPQPSEAEIEKMVAESLASNEALQAKIVESVTQLAELRDRIAGLDKKLGDWHEKVASQAA